MSIVKQAILEKVIQIVKDITCDWELDYDGKIDQNTRLVEDLGFASLDIIQFIVAIEEGFQRRDLPFEKLLLKEGRYVDELSIHEIADFIESNF